MTKDQSYELLKKDIEYIKKSVDDIKDEMKSFREEVQRGYVTLVYFDAVITPIRNIAFGLVGVVLVNVLGAILFIVLNQK